MATGTVFGYLVQIFISRTLGTQEFGTYSYALGILNVVKITAILAFDVASLRYVGVYRTLEHWQALRGFLVFSRWITLFLSLAGGLSGVFFVLLFKSQLSSGVADALLAACFLLIPAAMLTLNSSILQALRRIYEVRVPNMFVRPLVLSVILFTIAHGLGTQPTAAIALLGNAAGSTVAVLLSNWSLRRLLPDLQRHGPAEIRTVEWLKFCAANVGQSLIYLFLSHQGDVVIVGTLLNTTQAGLYSAASQIATFVLLGVATVNQFASPLIAEYHNRRTESGLRILLGRIMMLNIVLLIPPIAVVLVWGKSLLGTFGPDFVAAYPVILVLSIGCIVDAIWGGLWGDLLTMTGFQNESAILVVSVAFLNLLLTMFLTPRFGILGAACATTAAAVVRGFLLAAVIHYRLRFWPWSVRLV
jgi:O-antigen/teichoic acid export membrane protein